MVLTIENYEVLIDDEDYELVKDIRWKVRKSQRDLYVIFKSTAKDRKTYVIRMHRLIMGIQGDNWKNAVVDHINGNTLDNRKSNLRIATLCQNLMNSKKMRSNTSGYKGVNFHKSAKSDKPWRARISVNKKRIELGHFATAEEAGRAYDKAALEYHGEFAKLNFPKD